MPFSRPTLAQINDRILTDLQNRIEDSDSLLRRAVLKVLARVYAGACHLMYGFLNYIAKQLFATTADQAGLDAIAGEWGLFREPAVLATGLGTATGTNGSIIPAGARLQSLADEIYTVDITVTIAGGVGALAFTAEIAGADGNNDAGITLTFINPIVGVNTQVTVGTAGIAGGEDRETDDDLRNRILTRKQQPPHGGCEYDYEVWAKEVDGVTRAWTFPEYQGIGTIGLTFVRDDDVGITPDATEIAEVESYIIEHTDPVSGRTVGIPVTAEPGLFVFALAELPVDFTILLAPNTAAVQATVTAAIEDLLYREGGPGEVIYLSEVDEAISLAYGETNHRLTVPVADIVAGQAEVPVVGTITFGAYV